MGFVYFVALLLGLPGSYITRLGTGDKRIPYLFMSLLTFFSSIAVSFLPETFGCPLPETLASASEYGREQNYFAWKIKRKVQHSDQFPNDKDDDDTVTDKMI